jgi:hypothetical protein
MTKAEWYDKGLENLADIVTNVANTGDEGDSERYLLVLTRELGPLLAAGQVMRDSYDALYAAVHAYDMNPRDPLTVQTWDAAKQAFLEGSDGE